jgi:hypothetical protein
MATTTRKRLLDIADALDRWPTIRWDDPAVVRVTDTPTGAMLYLVGGLPLGERAAVYAAMPLLITDDFAEAARLVRGAAGALP